MKEGDKKNLKEVLVEDCDETATRQMNPQQMSELSDSIENIQDSDLRSQFELRNASSMMISVEEEQKEYEEPKQRESGSERNWHGQTHPKSTNQSAQQQQKKVKIAESQKSQDQQPQSPKSKSEIQLPTMNSKFQNMSGDQILKYIKLKLKTNPFQRWEMRKDKFPIKFLLHIFLIMFVTVQDIEHDSADTSKFFFTPKQVQENLKGLIEFFQEINEQAQFDVVNYKQTEFILLSYYTIWPTDKTHRLVYSNEIDIDEGIKSPFDQYDMESLKEYIQKVNMFTFVVSNLQTRFSVSSNICWDIKVEYIVDSHIMLAASVDADQITCINKPESEDKKEDPAGGGEDDRRNLQANEHKWGDTTIAQKLNVRLRHLLEQNSFIKQDSAGTASKKQTNEEDEDLVSVEVQVQKILRETNLSDRRIFKESLSPHHLQKQLRNFKEKNYSSVYQARPASIMRRSQNSSPRASKNSLYKKGRILSASSEKKNHYSNRNDEETQVFTVNLFVILIASSLFFLHMRHIYKVLVLYECAKQATQRAYLQNIRRAQFPSNPMSQSVVPSMLQTQQLQQSQVLGGSQPQGVANTGGTTAAGQPKKLKNIITDQSSIKWEHITFSEKLKFFNKWQLFCLLGNIFQISGTVLLFISQYTLKRSSEYSQLIFIFNIKERLIGFGCSIAWISIVQYVEYDREHIIVSTLLSRVAKQWLYTLIGILPLFMAFTLVGYSLYSESEFFQSIGYTMTTLFATYHGDQISDFMNSINDIGSPFEAFYMLIFTCLFAMAVYNFFTSTIGIAWDEIQTKKANKVLKEKLKQDYLFEKQMQLQATNPDRKLLQAAISGIIQQQDINGQSQQLTSLQQLELSPTLKASQSPLKTKPSESEQDNRNSATMLQSQEESQVVRQTPSAAFEKLKTYLQANKTDLVKVNLKIEEHKKFIWQDTVSKKTSIEQLFKEIVEFDQIILVLDIDSDQKQEIKAKYRRYINFLIGTITDLIDDVSKL